MIVLFLVLSIWFACGVIACGLDFAYFQRKYQLVRKSGFYGDRRSSFWCLIMGAVALGVHLGLFNTHHGWLWPWSAKAKREAGLIE